MSNAVKQPGEQQVKKLASSLTNAKCRPSKSIKTSSKRNLTISTPFVLCSCGASAWTVSVQVVTMETVTQ